MTTWAAVKDAEEYEVIVTQRAVRSPASTAAIPDRVVYKGITTKTALELKGLKPSNYVWTVRAIDRLKRKGEATQERGFSVTYGDVLKSPEVTSSEVQ